MTLKTGFLLFIALAMVILASTYVAKCTRDKPITKHHANRIKLVNADSLQSIIDTRHRAELSKVKQAYQDSLQRAKDNYRVIVQKDVRIEYRYRQAPSVAACDSVIDSKNSRIGALEDMTARQEQVSRVNDSLITSYAGTVRAKDQTIHQLNAGYEQAIVDLHKAKRPRRWGLGIMAGYGVGASLQPGPMIGAGISYNLVRF